MKHVAAHLALSVSCLIGALSSAQLPSHNAQNGDEIDAIVQSLPKCSHFRLELEQGGRGTGIEEPYMSLLREHGIKRAIFQVTAPLRRGHVGVPLLVARRLYFRRYDGPDAEITKPDELKAIRDSGLERILDNAALEKAQHAPVFAGIEHAQKLLRASRAVVGDIEFLDLPFLPQSPPVLVPSGENDQPLLEAALAGDVNGASSKAKHASKEVLNKALFFAISRRQDNSDVIRFLISAGADVNGRMGAGKSTTLMWAIPNPCNLPVLLQNGADINGRDRKGRTALQVAEQETPNVPLVKQSIELLRAASGGASQ
jgi:hypothetical protein